MMYPSNLSAEFKSARRVRLQHKAMHHFFIAGTFYLAGLATICGILAYLTS